MRQKVEKKREQTFLILFSVIYGANPNNLKWNETVNVAPNVTNIINSITLRKKIKNKWIKKTQKKKKCIKKRKLISNNTTSNYY